MPCIFYDVDIKGDSTGKIKNYVKELSNNRAEYYALLSSMFDENNTKARDFIYDHLTDDVKKTVSREDISTNETLFKKINKNTLKRIIREYRNTITNNIANFNSQHESNPTLGFSSAQAISDAKDYLSGIIKKKYYEAQYGSNDNTDNPNWNTQRLKILNPKDSKKALRLAVSADTFRLLRKKIQDLNVAPEELKSLINELDNTSKKDKEKRSKLIAQIKLKLGVFIKELGDEHKQLKNLYNAYILFSNDESFINEVFRHKSLTSVISHIDLTADANDSEYSREDESGLNNTDGYDSEQSKDEYSKSWDKTKRSFEQHIAQDVKLYLGSIKDPSKYNELGVDSYYDANYLIQQIISGVSNRNAFTSIDDFINALSDIANTVAELEGLKEVINDIKDNPTIGYRLFSELADPIVRKLQIRVREDGAEMSRSNITSEPVSNIIFIIKESFKSNIKNRLDISDLDKLVKLYPKNSADDNLKQQLDVLYEQLFHTYIPGFKYKYIKKYLENGDIKRYQKVYAVLKELLEKGRKINESLRQSMSDKGKIDYNKINYSSLDNTPNVIELAKDIIKYSVNDVKLTSYNAEHSMSSDLSDNNRISNILKQINYIADEVKAGRKQEAQKGLELLKSVVVQCKQFDYSPFFYGITDSQGNVLKEGLFTKKSYGVAINPNAADLVRTFVFDGINNHLKNKGSLYENMTRGDYFMSMLEAYNTPIDTYDYKGELKHQDKGGFFMTTPADKPGNSIMQLTAYKTSDLFYGEDININNEAFRAVRTLLFNELNTAIQALRSITYTEETDSTTHGNRTLIKLKTDGYFNYYHYKGDSFVNKDGKLSGRVFKIEKLFKINGYDVNNEIWDALSLYGQGNTGLIRRVEDKVIDGQTYAQYEVNPNGIKWLNSTNFTIKENEINDLLNDITKKWINAYKEYVTVEAKQYKSIIEDKFNDEQIFSMALNYVTAYSVFGEIIEGDFKFYKDTRTFIKRAKEGQAGGKAYGLYDLADGLTFDDFNSKIDRGDVLDKINLKVNHKVPIRHSFRGVCINNTIRDSRRVQAIKEELTAINHDEELSSFIANKQKNITVNDAQSYITFDEWIRRVYANGTINQYRDLIEAIYNLETDNNSDTGYKKLDLTGINGRINVQKNFYFDIAFDESLGIMYPRQIKNAEFVLIPQLLPKTSSLRKLHDIMEKNGIDQINTAETSKAAKKHVLTYWDKNGVEHPEEFDKAVQEKGAIETFYYRNLYKQQDIPNHLVDEQNKLGIQIAKKIVDNADMSDEKLAGYVNDYFMAYSSNIRTSFENFLNSLGWKYKNGKIVNSKGESISKYDFAKYYELGLNEAQRLGLNENFFDYYNTDETGIPIMPSFMNNVSTKLESIAQSLFNSRVTKQKMPGYHVAQISAIGLWDKPLAYHPDTYVDLENHKEISKEDYDKLPVDEKDKYTRAVYMEILIPKWFSNPHNLTDEELLTMLQEEGLDYHINYRIPTEGKQSIVVAKVVGFLDDTYGSTIAVPDEWVAQTGSDMDGDSVYGIVQNFEWVLENEGTEKESWRMKKIKYDRTKSADENSIAAKQNLMFDSMLGIMHHPNSREENYMSSNFADIERVLKLYEKEADEATNNVFFQVNARDDAMSGARLKALSVTRDTFNSVNNRLHTKLAKKNGIKVNYLYDEKTYNKLKDRYGDDVTVPFTINGIKYFSINHRNMGWSNDNRNVVDRLVTVYSSETTAHILDAVKAGTIPNENEFTFGVFKTLVDVGISYETAIRFLMNPAITKLVNAWNNTNSMFINPNSTPEAIVFKDIAIQLGLKVNNEDITQKTPIKDVKRVLSENKEFIDFLNRNGYISKNIFEQTFPINEQFLTERLNNGAESTNKDDLFFDLVIAITFNQYKKTADAINSIAQCTNPDKFGAKQTINQTRKIIDKIEIKYRDPEVYATNVLTVEQNDKEVPLLQALYSEDSKYPSLKAYYEYATLQSVFINSVLFDLEQPEFTRVLNSLTDYLGRELNDEEYKIYKQYLVSSSIRYSRLLNVPLTINEQGFIIIDTNRIEESGVDGNTLIFNEKKRLFGIEETETIFKFENREKPTEEDIKKFNKLTPAQKVNAIKLNFDISEHAELGIFDYLTTESYVPKEAKKRNINYSRISYSDNINNTDELISLFNSAFFSKNPFVRLTAIDLIKYAFHVEHFSFRSGNLSKIISNESMLKFSDNGFTNLIDELRNAVLLNNINNPQATSQLINDFIRSHPYLAKSLSIKYSDKIGDLYPEFGIRSDIVKSDYGNLKLIQSDILLNAISKDESEFPVYLNVDIKNKDKTVTSTLYKIVIIDNGLVWMYPVNKLDRNEYGEVSLNDENNKFYSSKYFETLIDKLSPYVEEDLEEERKKRKETEFAEKVVIDVRKYDERHEELKKEIDKLVEENKVSKVDANESKKFIEDEKYLVNNTNQREIKGFVEKIQDALEETNGPALIFNPSYTIHKLFISDIANIAVNQKIIINGEERLVEIRRKRFSEKSPQGKYIRYKSARLVNPNIDNLNAIARLKINDYEKPALEDSINNLGINKNFYELRIITDESFNEILQNAQTAQAEIDNNNRYSSSITPDIIDSQVTNDPLDTLAKTIIDHISVDNINSEEARKVFGNELKDIGILSHSLRTIAEHKDSIYKHAKSYYKACASILDDEIQHFQVSSGETYNIDDPNLYLYLLNSPEDYGRLIKLILDAKTFGEQISSIFDITFTGVDEELTKDLKDIKSYIDKIRKLPNIKAAFKNLFNIYYMNKFSDNPVLRRGIVEVTEAFNDITDADKWLSDVTELNHKQVQLITKNVYSIISQATQLIAPEAVRKFKAELREITGGEDVSKYKSIDENGKIVQKYNDKFIEDEEKLKEEVNDVLLTYGKLSKEYVNAQLKYDEWLAKNKHRPALQEYYLADIQNRKNILNDAPDLYFKYLELTDELYDVKKSLGVTQDEADRRWEIKQKINQLRSQTNSDGTQKDPYEKLKAKALNNFINTRAKLRKDNFEVEGINNFDKELEINVDIIKQHKIDHPNYTLEELMQDNDYRNAREWLFENAHFKIKDEISEKINDAYSKLKIDTTGTEETSNTILKELKSKRNRYDILGILNGSKFSKDEVDLIRKKKLEEYDNKENIISDAALIQDNGVHDEVYKEEFYNLFNGKTLSEEEIKEKREIITKINKLLRVGLDSNGKLKSELLFGEHGLTDDELETLAYLYGELRKVSHGSNNSNKHLFNDAEFTVDVEAYAAHRAYFNEYIQGKSARREALWNSIFLNYKYDENGIYTQEAKPNTYLFGFLTCKEDKKEQYIDKEKTEAKRYLRETVTYQTTEYYDKAKRTAIENGSYEEWYYNNHVYNPYAHKYEALPIWTTMQINPTLDAYEYAPSGDSKYSRVKKDKVNLKYDASDKTMNYNTETGEYTNEKYLALTEKERKVADLFQRTINSFALGDAARKFAKNGFAPRRYSPKIDRQWVLDEALRTAGISFGNDVHNVIDNNLSYTNNKDKGFDMLQQLKVKGYKEVSKAPQISEYRNPEAYDIAYKEWKERKTQIEKENAELEKSFIDRDWENVFTDFIRKATEYEARQKVKNDIFVLLESLKDEPAYKLNSKNKIVKGKLQGTDYSSTATVAQNNTYTIVHNWANRILYGAYKEEHVGNKFANMMQNMTSAKYMMLNLTGGISNVTTGLVNIKNETFAKMYFSDKDFRNAEKIYTKDGRIFKYIAAWSSDNIDDKYVGITKLFDVVDYDGFKGIRNKKTLSDYADKFQDILYSMQSGGEHYMQNCVLYAMLQSHKLFEKHKGQGDWTFGSFADYTQLVEEEALNQAIKSFESDTLDTDDIKKSYEQFVLEIKHDNQLKRDFDRFKEDFNASFIRRINNKEFTNKYIEIRKKLLNEAKEEFESFDTLDSQIEFVDGVTRIKPDSKFTAEMFGLFRNKVISVNKKIHGVYDKDGSAMLERKWFGSLLMQYHKHMYPGFMKRYRGLFGGGMYNEVRSGVDRGSYVSLAKLLTTDARLKWKQLENDENKDILLSIKTIAEGLLESAINFKVNYNLLPEWERANIDRVKGDVIGIVAAMLLAIAIYGLCDDDDIKNDNFLATSIYLSDRLFSETNMYSPLGIIPEFETLYSSPVAAYNGPKDAFETLGLIWDWMTDPDFNITYTTGLYKGQNKLEVKLRRNIPVVRTVDRLKHMSKNNKYYRMGDSNINLKIAKEIAEILNPEE